MWAYMAGNSVGVAVAVTMKILLRFSRSPGITVSVRNCFFIGGLSCSTFCQRFLCFDIISFLFFYLFSDIISFLFLTNTTCF